jgi:hypothetical protein
MELFYGSLTPTPFFKFYFDSEGKKYESRSQMNLKESFIEELIEKHV